MPDQAGEQVRAEDPAVEREVTEVVLDHRQDGRHRQRLEPDQRDREHEPGREGPARGCEDPSRVRCLRRRRHPSIIAPRPARRIGRAHRGP